MATDPAIVSLAKPASIEEGRWGSGLVRIIEVALFDGEGKPAHMFESGDPVRIGMRVEATQDTSDFVFGIGIFNTEGVCVYGTNTDIEEYEPVALSGIVNVDVIFASLELTEGTYKVDVAVHSRDGVPYDYHRLLYTFRVKSRTKDVGIYRPKHAWEFSLGVTMKPRA
jgi:hypothetical protein